MNNFEDSIARMKALYTYGTVNESKKQSNSTLEYSAKAADGKTYGIVKECNHFYIKQAADGKEKLAEGYDYIGGYMNKNNYRYDSYANALKHLELKLSSINEAHDAKVDVTTLDPFKKEIVLAEATDKMKAEIARQRQIMYNASMIMNESTDYAVKGGKACTTSQPEAETGAKGDKAEGSKEAKAQPDYKGSHVGLDKKAEPFKENPGKGKDMNESCEGGSCDTDFDAGLKSFGSTADGKADTDHNNDPFNKSVNEEDEKEWDKGLPASAGVGEADTDHNNDPFNKSVNESSEDDLDVDVKGDEDEDINSDDDDFDFGDDIDTDVDVDTDTDSVDSDEDVDLDDDTLSDEGDEDIDTDVDSDLEDNEDVDLGDDTLSDEGDEDVDLGDETDPEYLRSEIERLQGLLNDIEGGDETSDLDSDLGDDTLSDEGDFDAEDTDFDEGLDSYDEDEDLNDDMYESKRNFMNSIVESVVKSLKGSINEDELHVFGKHPGYRKKPMQLPPTGEDKNEHGEDWNDESVHSEEPFGKQIGDSSPFNELVNNVTKDVMYQLKHGVTLDNKKKAE